MERDKMIHDANEFRGNTMLTDSESMDLKFKCTNILKFLFQNTRIEETEFCEFAVSINNFNYTLTNDTEIMTRMLDLINFLLEVTNLEVIICASVELLIILYDLYPSFKKIIMNIIYCSSEDTESIFQKLKRLFTYPSNVLQDNISAFFLSLSESDERDNIIFNLAEMYLQQACTWTIESIDDLSKLNSLGFIGNVLISQCPLDEASICFIFSKMQTLVNDKNSEIRNLSCWVMSNILEFYDITDVREIAAKISEFSNIYFQSFRERISTITNGEALLSNSLLNNDINPFADLDSAKFELFLKTIQETQSEKVEEHMLKIIVRYLSQNVNMSQVLIQQILENLEKSFNMNMKCRRLSVLAIGKMLKFADLDSKFQIISNNIIANCFDFVTDAPDKKCLEFVTQFVSSFELLKSSGHWTNLLRIYESSGLDLLIQELLDGEQDDYVELCERLNKILND